MRRKERLRMRERKKIQKLKKPGGRLKKRGKTNTEKWRKNEKR